VPVAALPEAAAPLEDRVGELLELLPEGARDVMVQRYVHEQSHAEIANALGISAAAVAMRLTRGKHALRRILAEAEWRPLSLPCPLCGTRKLLMRRDATEISFRCPVCTPEHILVRYPLENPQFARLVSGLERPTAMFRRVGDWALGYFACGGGATAACTRCGEAVTLRAHRRSSGARGLYVRCSFCGEELWSSLAGLASALPAVRELRPLRLLAVQEARGVVVVVQASLDGSRAVEVAFDRNTFALLGVA
jgi:ribosomal protein S27E